MRGSSSSRTEKMFYGCLVIWPKNVTRGGQVWPKICHEEVGQFLARGGDRGYYTDKNGMALKELSNYQTKEKNPLSTVRVGCPEQKSAGGLYVYYRCVWNKLPSAANQQPSGSSGCCLWRHTRMHCTVCLLFCAESFNHNSFKNTYNTTYPGLPACGRRSEVWHIASCRDISTGLFHINWTFWAPLRNHIMAS